MPPQPAGIWNSVYNDSKWIDATGPDRYRRAIYTFVKRTAGYPSSLIFDASDRDTSLPRRIATNTPLQALVTLNDPVYEEAARALARRVIKDTAEKTAGASSAARYSGYPAYLRSPPGLISRSDRQRELAVLRKFYQNALAMRSRPAVVKASLNLSQTLLGKSVSGGELDALTAVGSVLFNLDAALVR